MTAQLNPSGVVVLEHVVRRCGLAIAVTDMTTGEPLHDGIVATAWRADRPDVVLRAGGLTGRGVGGFTALPGLTRYEDGSTARRSWFTVPPAFPHVSYVVRVEDIVSGHLPALLEVPVPQAMPVPVALPPSPQRPVPGGWLGVVATVVDTAGGPASWAVVQLDVGGFATGGVCAADGLVVVAVPRAAQPSAVGTPNGGPVWTATVTVRFRPGDQLPVAGAAAADPPSLASILGQRSAAVRDGAAFGPALQRDLLGATTVIASVAPPQPEVPSVLVVRPVP